MSKKTDKIRALGSNYFTLGSGIEIPHFYAPEPKILIQLLLMLKTQALQLTGLKSEECEKA
jgi:hypothetical protein